MPWRTVAAEARLQLEQPQYARRLAEQELDRLGDRDSHAQGVALRILAAASPRTERLSLLTRAAKLLRACDSRYELSRCLADMSQVHRATGHVRWADFRWRQALRLAAQCGIEEPPYTLPPKGDRPSLVDAPPQDRLSKAEWRVACLASAGRSNRQIAGELYVTLSTVEQHLTRVYRKLGVSSRADLRRILPPVGGG
ncbi:helix-turn-helix transcriptional regulator [Streptomyces sp. NBC_01451]|uniref:helix-turn-helix transcriptional regulator n=1 Tax=Streptomyces sp. NBC_01451 TaxID=2903872 RepID=UPI002E3237AF|nr:helix-turn-helix transcriptional regulator [Streptomyces sp. NBC_01451]